MERMWQTDEVIRQLETDADVEEIKELIEEAEQKGQDPEEEVRKWVRSGAAPKGLYDAILRFSNAPDKAFLFVEWDEVIFHFSRLEI